MFLNFCTIIKNTRCHILYILLFILPLSFSITSHATSNESSSLETPTIQNGIVKIVSYCVDESGNQYYVHGGNGFVIGTLDSQQYILTDYKLVVPSEEDYNKIRHGVALSSNINLTNKVDIYFPGNIALHSTIVACNEQAGYALLQPAYPINNLTYLQLGTTLDVNQGETLFLPGYSGTFSLMGKDSVPEFVLEVDDYEVLSIETDPLLLKINDSPSTGKSGAPLINAAGDVIGMMCYNAKTNSLKVIPSETLSIMLNTLGISFYDSNLNNEYNLANKEIISEFKSLLSDCQQDVIMNENQYSQSSLKAYKDAIEKAVEISNKYNATKDEYQECIDALTSTKKKLKPVDFTYFIVQSVLLVIILFFLHLNVRQVLKCKRLKESLQPKQTKKQQKKRKQLGALIRIDTNEVIWLTKKGLRIGKSGKDADYSIYDNPTIDLLHVTILYENERFYIMNHNSANKTCINHSPIEPQKNYELLDEDTISLSNISFTFRYLQNP